MSDETAESTAQANLEAENTERLKRLLATGFPMPPTLFENLRILTYLETLLKEADLLDDANAEFTNRATTIIDQMETMQRQQAIVAGTIKPEEIDKIIQMRPR